MLPLLRTGFVGRDTFGDALNEMGLDYPAVEVGTHKGAFAHQLLLKWGGRKLYCVDPYTPNYDPGDPAALGDRVQDEADAVALLAPFGDRAEFVNLPSVQAATHFRDGSLDFVYVDGNHQPDHVETDLEAWWPKVRPGGLLAGHDIVTGEPDGGWGRFIQPVVFRFAWDNNLPVYLVSEADGMPWSYYLVKP